MTDIVRRLRSLQYHITETHSADDQDAVTCGEAANEIERLHELREEAVDDYADACHEIDRLRSALHRIVTTCGHPSPLEGLRSIIEIARAALEEKDG